MNWIWEDEISSITIDRHVPCIVSYCKVDKVSVGQLSEYLQELRKTLMRFPEIYPDLKIVFRYHYDASIEIHALSALLEELVEIISTAQSTKIGLVNDGDSMNELPIEALIWKKKYSFQARHFMNESTAKNWLTMPSGVAVL